MDIIDYLLKPIAFDRFLKAVDRYRERTLQTIPKEIPKSKETAFIFVNVNRTHHKVILTDILYIESLKDYVRIHTKKDRLVVKGNIGTFMKQIPSNQFIRVHRSYAIALQYITSYNQSEVDIEGHRLPIGVSYREGFISRITNL